MFFLIYLLEWQKSFGPFSFFSLSLTFHSCSSSACPPASSFPPPPFIPALFGLACWISFQYKSGTGGPWDPICAEQLPCVHCPQHTHAHTHQRLLYSLLWLMLPFGKTGLCEPSLHACVSALWDECLRFFH